MLHRQVDDVGAVVRAGLQDLARLDRRQHPQPGERKPAAAGVPGQLPQSGELLPPALEQLADVHAGKREHLLADHQADGRAAVDQEAAKGESGRGGNHGTSLSSQG